MITSLTTIRPGGADTAAACEQFENSRAAICEAVAVRRSATKEDIALEIQFTYGGDWSISRTTLFNTLTALRADGILVAEDSEGRQGRRYSLTEKGRDLLLLWMTVRIARLNRVAEMITAAEVVASHAIAGHSGQGPATPAR